MTLARRVAAAERRLGLRGPCRECGGHGRLSFLVGDQEPTDDGACARCGALGLVMHIVVDPRAAEMAKGERPCG